MTIDDQDSKARGRARDRIRKRKERDTQDDARQPSVVMPAPSPRRTQGPQLTSGDARALPKIDLRAGLWPLYIILAASFLLGGVWFLGQLNAPEAEAPPNALWVSTEWTYTRHDDTEMAAFVAQLKEHRIGTVYAWVSWLQTDGTWAGSVDRRNQFDAVRGDVEAFVVQFKRLYPEARLLGWMGLPLGSTPQNYGLNETQLTQRVDVFTQTIITQLGFDGVHLQIAPVADNDQAFLALLRTARAQLQGTYLSVSVPPDWTPTAGDTPLSPLYAPNTVWSTAYKQNVALIADEIVITAYNSGLTRNDDYAAWMAYQVRTFTSAVAAVPDAAQIVIGIPTHDSAVGHDAQVENIASAVLGIRAGLADSGAAGALLRGTALYGAWSTDAQEWLDYRRLWSGG
jgi:hypothetical protein